MDSIKERFINKFMGHDEVASEAIFAFIKEELNKLANEIEQGFGKGTKAAVTIIRTQADLI